MPKLIRLCLTEALIDFALSVGFLGPRVWPNVAWLGQLDLHTAAGGVATVILFVMNSIIFSGVQFAIATMRLADDAAPPHAGHRAHNVLRAMPCKGRRPVAPKICEIGWRARSGRDGVNFPRA